MKNLIILKYGSGKMDNIQMSILIYIAFIVTFILMKV